MTYKDDIILYYYHGKVRINKINLINSIYQIYFIFSLDTFKISGGLYEPSPDVSPINHCRLNWKYVDLLSRH